MDVKNNDETTLKIIRLIQANTSGLVLETDFLFKKIGSLIGSLEQKIKCDMISQEINRINRAVSEYKRAIEFRT